MPSVPHFEEPSASTEDAAAGLLYLYCVFEAGAEARRLLASRAVAGLDPDEPLFPIEAAGLMAAVSRVPAHTFAEAPLNALVQDLTSLAPYAVRHEEAVRALLPAVPALVPMTFGAVYRGAQGVLDLLHREAAVFRRILAALRHRQEWSLKVFGDVERLYRAAESGSDELRRLAAAADASPPGRAYLLRKQRERLLAAEVQRYTARLLDRVFEDLERLGVAMRRDPIPAEAGAQGGRLVLKAALLVDEARLDRLQETVSALGSAYAPHGLTLEISGPWAPYSFARDADDAD